MRHWTAWAAAVVASVGLAGVVAADEGYAYDSGGRRDPFLQRKGTGEPPALEALGLRGIVKTQQGYRALLVDAAGNTLFAVAGDRAKGVEVVAVDASGVTLRQTVASPGEPARTRDWRLRLHADGH